MVRCGRLPNDAEMNIQPLQRLGMTAQVFILCKSNVKGDRFGVVRFRFSRLEMLRHDGRDDRDLRGVEALTLLQNGRFGRFRNGNQLINAPERPCYPNLFHQPELPAGVIVNESNVMNGKNNLGAVSPPLRPGECREMDITCDVKGICFDGEGLPDDVPSILPALTEMRCLNPNRFGLFGPDIRHLSKRQLNAEVAEGAFFSEEPGNAHQRELNLNTSTMDFDHILDNPSNPSFEKWQ